MAAQKAELPSEKRETGLKARGSGVQSFRACVPWAGICRVCGAGGLDRGKRSPRLQSG